MPHGAITALFGIGVGVTVASALFARRGERDDAHVVAVTLLMAYLTSKAIIALIGWYSAAVLFPLTDCIQVMVVMDCWVGARRRWKLAVVGLLILKMVFNVGYQLTFAAAITGDAKTHIATIYQGLINGAFAAELVCASWPGGQGLGDRLGRALSRYRAYRRGGLPQAGRT